MTGGAVYWVHNATTSFVKPGDVVLVCNEKYPTKYLDRSYQVRLTDNGHRLTAFTDESEWLSHPPTCK